MASSSHLNERGEARMVDVSRKGVTERRAVARGALELSRKALQAILDGTVPKGDVLAVARVAGIQAAKRTAELLPLCHPLALTSVEVDVVPRPERNRVEIEARVTAVERTGVEMEALLAVSVAALAVYDMVKGIDREMRVGPIELVEKTGGQSGTYRKPARPAPAERGAPEPEEEVEPAAKAAAPARRRRRRRRSTKT